MECIMTFLGIVFAIMFGWKEIFTDHESIAREKRLEKEALQAQKAAEQAEREREQRDQLDKRERKRQARIDQGRHIIKQQQRTSLLQKSLRQLRQCPDFRRCGSVAAECETLSPALRRRLFAHYRREMVRHYTMCRQRGLQDAVLLPQLTQLVQSLAVAPFEAQYIARDARKRLPTTSKSTRQSYAQQLQGLRQQHVQRLQVIRETIEDEDLRDQMIETEEDRFRNVVLQSQENQ